MTTARIDELEEVVDALEVEIEELHEKNSLFEYDLELCEAHHDKLAEAVDRAVKDLNTLVEVPLGDLEASIEAIAELLREVL